MFKKIFLSLLMLPSICLSEVIADKCIQKSEHKSMSLFLVDLSDKITEPDNFNKSASVFSEMIQPGERVIVAISTDKVGDVKLLMDLVLPEDTIWESKLKTRALQKKFHDCLNQNLTTILAFDKKYDKSAILETVYFTSKIFSSDVSPIKKLFLYSDMMQNSPSLSLYSQKDLDTKALLAQTQKENLIPTLDNIDIYVAGIGAHESDKKTRQLEIFWGAFFEKAHAKLKYFGPILVGP
jgi:hypothetical protein